MGDVWKSSPPPPQQQTGCLKGCLIAFVVGIALLVAAGYGLYYLDEYQHNANIAGLNTTAFNMVKAGAGRALIFDPAMIEMLANDEQCIANLTFLTFIEQDLSDPRFKDIAKLKNLRTVEFYDCHNDEKLLAAMQGMPSVEEMEFDSMLESADRTTAEDFSESEEGHVRITARPGCHRHNFRPLSYLFVAMLSISRPHRGQPEEKLPVHEPSSSHSQESGVRR